MPALRGIVVALSLIQGAWLAFDGGRAWIVGDYVTPSAGPRAGQLGPWARVVSALGLDPRGGFVKSLHVVLGVAWLIAAVLLVVRPATGWWAALVCGVATLWYLPIGTVLSIIILALLLTQSLRNAP
jgi:hypothetical protein